MEKEYEYSTKVKDKEQWWKCKNIISNYCFDILGLRRIDNGYFKGNEKSRKKKNL